ncbi:molybdopterin converting factor [Paenibacillus sp. FSL H8-0548]|uniref:molybdenum cofactor biosynthesis protein n=1 Tax=Paenibacillus sp. FSL H8-0548 TaxID=1920422 RepID=UPI00096D969C|nr:molybdenum cofactor biosynthesis protein MoaE [Paenibacillus sp. FSL H8-0548]OMF31767.1 molybdopterin converting factor [Paenibacillus sp. FSL H8-0548]
MTYNWSIQLFAGLPERLGTTVINMQSDAEAMSVADLKAAISALYPAHAAIIHVSFIACNQAYAADEILVNASDELALLPPVSGGEGQASPASESVQRYVITTDTISADDVLAKVIVPEHGAALTFVGTTREWTHGQRTVRLEYEAYAPMAIATMQQIGDEIAERWQGALCAITHRVGVVGLAETSVAIAVSSAHRESCYEASRYAIERLKQIVPIWKKEIWEDGSEWKGHQLGPWNPIEKLSEF